MTVKPVPKGFHTLTPYPQVRGAAELIDFLKRAFGAKVAGLSKDDGKVLHAEVRIGDSMMELSEARGKWKPMPCAIHLYVGDADRVYEQALKAGTKSLYEPADRHYGDREAGVKDPSGNVWYIATHIKDAS